MTAALAVCACAEPASVPAVTEVGVTIEVRPGLRDLVATAVGESAVPWTWMWQVDGEPTPWDTERVPATALWPGQLWRATVKGLDAKGGPLEGHAEAEIPAALGGNVLVIMLDDVGVDKLGMYGITDGPPTPTLDALAAESLQFSNAWAAPTCSPTRAMALTGRLPHRHGTGQFINMNVEPYAHPTASIFLPTALAESRTEVWSNLALGKWHLAGETVPRELAHPHDSGFERFFGSPGYLNEGSLDYDGYFLWRKNVDGVAETVDVYNTTDTVNDALAHIPELPEPWFVWLSFNAAHTPYHIAPEELVTQALPLDPTEFDLFDGMVEAMDTEMGRLFDGLGSDLLGRTTRIVIGDNGTSDLVAEVFDPSHAKGSVYEGGVRVPMWVSGPHVADPGRVVETPVLATDIFPTVLDLAGAPLQDDNLQLLLPLRDGGTRELDGVSLLPLMMETAPDWKRTVIVTEKLIPNGPPPWLLHLRAVQDGRFKLQETFKGTVEMYDLTEMYGLVEGPDKMLAPLSAEAQAAYDTLSAALASLDAEPYEGF